MTATASPVDDAIAAVRSGRLVVIVDAEAPDEGGMLVAAAHGVTGASVQFMSMHGSGLVGVAMAAERLGALDVPPMPARRGARGANPLHTGVDGPTAGVAAPSAEGRARTIRALSDPTSTAADFHCPGHVFPLGVHKGGVLTAAQRPAAAFDLVALADAGAGAAVCRLVGSDGSLRSLADATAFGRQHDLTVISVGDLLVYRLRRERIVTRAATARLPTRIGEFRAVAYADAGAGREHLALVCGEFDGPADGGVLVRLQSECFEADALRGLRCTCAARMQAALEAIRGEGRGVLLYLRGPHASAAGLIGGGSDDHAGLDTRALGAVPGILRDLGAPRIRLLSAGERSLGDGQQLGLQVVGEVHLHHAAVSTR